MTRYGVSWQVTPAMFEDMLLDSDQEKVDRVMKALLQMGKLDMPSRRAPPRDRPWPAEPLVNPISL